MHTGVQPQDDAVACSPGVRYEPVVGVRAAFKEKQGIIEWRYELHRCIFRLAIRAIDPGFAAISLFPTIIAEVEDHRRRTYVFFWFRVGHLGLPGKVITSAPRRKHQRFRRAAALIEPC